MADPTPVALLLSGVTGLWGALSTVVWWAARNQGRLHQQNYHAERERSARLERDCERKDERYDQLRRESMQDLAKYMLAGESLARLYEDLRAGKVPKPRKEPPP